MPTTYRRMLFLFTVLALASCSSAKQPGATLAPVTLEQTYHEGQAAYTAGVELEGLGKLQEASGKFVEAAEKFARVVSADPQHLHALINWGLALDRIGKPVQAMDKYQQALAQDAKKAEAYYNWGWTLERLRRHEEAVEKYEQALELNAELMTPALQRYLQHHRPQQQDDTRVKTPLPRSVAPRSR